MPAGVGYGNENLLRRLASQRFPTTAMSTGARQTNKLPSPEAAQPPEVAQLMSLLELNRRGEILPDQMKLAEMPLSPGDLGALLRAARFTDLLGKGVNIPTSALGRVRSIARSPERVAPIEESIRAKGQLDPISLNVDESGVFVNDGTHRLQAIRNAGLPETRIGIVPNVADDNRTFEQVLRALGL